MRRVQGIRCCIIILIFYIHAPIVAWNGERVLHRYGLHSTYEGILGVNRQSGPNFRQIDGINRIIERKAAGVVDAQLNIKFEQEEGRENGEGAGGYEILFTVTMEGRRLPQGI